MHAGGADTSVTLDQTAADGWQTLGEFDFAAGGDQCIHLADNTGEPLAGNVQLVFDAVRLTRIVDDGTGSGSDQSEDDPAKRRRLQRRWRQRRIPSCCSALVGRAPTSLR